jgi:hypothetical protein
LNEIRAKIKEEQRLEADRKLALKVESFKDADFQSAMSKLTEAAIKFDKSGPGGAYLKAFDAVSMPPHVFKVSWSRVAAWWDAYYACNYQPTTYVYVLLVTLCQLMVLWHGC